jgi:Homing endonuclease associated repeat/HNH endonuclease
MIAHMPQFELSRLDSYDNDSLLNELRRVAAIVAARVLTQSAFHQHSKASVRVISSRFGGWHRALDLAGLKDRGSEIRVKKRILLRGVKTFTDVDMLDNLRSVAKALGTTTITIKQFNCDGIMTAATIIERFGSWRQAVELAGLTISNLGKRYSASEYFENLLTVWTHYGRQPTYGEMDQRPSTIRASAYRSKWSSWRNALKAFLGQINSDITVAKENQVTTSAVTRERSEEAPTATVSIVTTDAPRRRTLSVGVRYDVLRRDHFRCVICGASPATLIGCELQVDHIIAVARGGENSMENLRALCKNCNLGKSAKVESTPTVV